jgi:hypothetical protein
LDTTLPSFVSALGIRGNLDVFYETRSSKEHRTLGGVCHSPAKQLPSFEIVRYHALRHNKAGTLQGPLYVLVVTVDGRMELDYFHGPIHICWDFMKILHNKIRDISMYGNVRIFTIIRSAARRSSEMLELLCIAVKKKHTNVFWRKSKAPILAVVSGPTLLEQFHQDFLQVAKRCSTSVLATPFRSTFRILTWAFMAF